MTLSDEVIVLLNVSDEQVVKLHRADDYPPVWAGEPEPSVHDLRIERYRVLKPNGQLVQEGSIDDGFLRSANGDNRELRFATRPYRIRFEGAPSGDLHSPPN